MIDLRKSSVFLKRSPPVDRARPDADCRTHCLPGGLYRAVEYLLNGSCAALQPVLPAFYPEELRRLKYAQSWLRIEVRQRLGQKILPADKIGIKQEDELSATTPEAEVQVARFP